MAGDISCSVATVAMRASTYSWPSTIPNATLRCGQAAVPSDGGGSDDGCADGLRNGAGRAEP